MSGRAGRPVPRRKVLFGLALATMVAGIGAGYRSFTRTRADAVRRLDGRSTVIDTPYGVLEYAEAGTGEPVLMIHGTGGGFDQGLAFGHGLVTRGCRVIAPSRFGYLRSSFPLDRSPGDQANALAALLDHLVIERIAVVGGSAGAVPAAAFALNHPDRCSALVLLVPAMNLTGQDPVEMSPLMQWSVRRLLESDLLFWLALKAAPESLVGTLLATDPALLDSVTSTERDRAFATLRNLMPISQRAKGMLHDAGMAGDPSGLDLAQLCAPTLVLTTEDDRFNTADTARRIEALVPGTSLHVYPTGGHIWLGHDEVVADEIVRFMARHRPSTAKADF